MLCLFLSAFATKQSTVEVLYLFYSRESNPIIPPRILLNFQSRALFSYKALRLFNDLSAAIIIASSCLKRETKQSYNTISSNKLMDNLVLSTELTMQVSHRKEIRKLTFRALALRQINNKLMNCNIHSQ